MTTQLQTVELAATPALPSVTGSSPALMAWRRIRRDKITMAALWSPSCSSRSRCRHRCSPRSPAGDHRETLYSRPRHPNTRALLSAVPEADPDAARDRERIRLTGDVPSPVDLPSGCRFRTRCPKFANHLTDAERTVCVGQVPELTERGGAGPVACHYPETVDLS